jgi:hypothetical protein
VTPANISGAAGTRRRGMQHTLLMCATGLSPAAAAAAAAGLALYGFITFLMDGPAALLIAVMGLKVVPPFDKPWLSETLADFWSRSVQPHFCTPAQLSLNAGCGVSRSASRTLCCLWAVPPLTLCARCWCTLCASL